jgi:hypothetical protein
MARAPSGKISKTIGQGISRGISQKARQLGGGSGSGMTPIKTSTGFDTPGVASGRRTYAKSSMTSGGNKAEYSSREMPNPNLGELSNAFKGKVPKAGKGFL